MKVSYADAAAIFRGLGALLHAGLSLADGVYLLSQEEAADKKKLLETIGNLMDQGYPLEAAMEETEAFPEAAVGMIRIGQTTGRLEETLYYLAEFYEERVILTRQIKSALGYPTLIMVLMLTVIGALLAEVLPVFDRVYASLGSGLTGLAGGLLALGQGLKAAMPAFLTVIGLVLAASFAAFYVRPLRERLSAWFMARFGDKAFARKFNNAQFAHAMAMGLGSGLGLDESLELAEKLLAHIPGAARRCQTCAQKISEGVDLAKALEETALLPPAMSRMLSLGLRSGGGDVTMADIANRLSREARESLEDTVARVEPAMVLICSVLVGLILLAVMLPLMNIMAAIG